MLRQIFAGQRPLKALMLVQISADTLNALLSVWNDAITDVQSRRMPTAIDLTGHRAAIRCFLTGS
jgi:hypothetical protein